MNTSQEKNLDRSEYARLMMMALKGGQAFGGFLGLVILGYIGFVKGAMMGMFIGIIVGTFLGTHVLGYLVYRIMHFFLRNYRRSFREAYGEDI